MLSVVQARARVLAGVAQLAAETVPLRRAYRRVLAHDLVAKLSQPPFAASAMDGYALRASDIANGGKLRVIGEAAAGRAFAGIVAAGEAVRIFTGAIVPEGADQVVPQEAAARDGELLAISHKPGASFVRAQGLDFAKGATLLAGGSILVPGAVGLAAAGGFSHLPVIRRPKVAILATGDEIVAPGEQRSEGQIFGSSLYACEAACAAAGAETFLLGIAPDRADAIDAKLREAADIGADILVTLGGASVGDHDLMREALTRAGGELGFWRIRMRPGKPLIFGMIAGMRFLGLPGNPASSFVCCWLFVLPLIRAMLGLSPEPQTRRARLAIPLPANDEREDYLRAALSTDDEGRLTATPFSLQDSSLQSVLAKAECLVLRAPGAAPAAAGEACTVLPFDL